MHAVEPQKQSLMAAPACRLKQYLAGMRQQNGARPHVEQTFGAKAIAAVIEEYADDKKQLQSYLAQLARDHDQIVQDLYHDKDQMMDYAEQNEQRAELFKAQAQRIEAGLKDELIAGMKERDAGIQAAWELVRSQTADRNR